MKNDSLQLKVKNHKTQKFITEKKKNIRNHSLFFVVLFLFKKKKINFKIFEYLFLVRVNFRSC